ncbi:MAG: MFS transporter [Caldilineaceae bacterium SB0668_bin_21]|nr:MFS transporter [Caldilineaceae bacterium SB0668_bin_21]MYC22023.1 MFS transporter [Caldilineaceae bacterium SB0662_bin_25]
MTANTTTETAVSYSDLLRHNRNFRYLWFGQIVSLLGDWFNLVASAALVGMLTQSGLAVGSLFVVRMLAPFLVSPIAGVVADRYNRKNVLIAADLIRAAVVLAFLLVRNPGDVWLLYTLTAVQMAMSGFFDPAHTAILPDISNPRELGAVNALSSATWSVMLALGAALGGLFSGTFGMYPAFVLDTFTFLLSAVLLAQIRMPANLASAADRTVAAAFGQYLRGLRYLRAHLDVLVVALQKAVMALFFATAFQVLQVAIAQQVFTVGQGGGTSLGLMFGLTGVGSGLGPILARKLTGEDPRSLKEAIAYGYVLAIAGIIVTAPLLSLPMVLLGSFVRSIGSGIIWVFSTHLLLQMVPDEVRGRVFASDFMFFYLGSALASSLVGAALDTTLTIPNIIWTMAAIGVAPTILWTLWVIKGRQKVA